MPKATYMYWQKRFDRENPDIELEEKIHEIHKCNKDYGYRRMCGELRNQGLRISQDFRRASQSGIFHKQKESSTHCSKAWITGNVLHSQKQKV